MARFYHGSIPRYLIDGLGYGARRLAKGVGDAMASLSTRAGDRARHGLLRDYRKAVRERNWGVVEQAAGRLAVHAQASADAALMNEMSAAFQRLEDFGRAAELALASRRLRKGRTAREWTGEDIGEATLLVDLTESAKQSIGAAVRNTLLLGACARRTRRCIALVEPRLVPIVRRSFPALDHVGSTLELKQAEASADCHVAYPEHLAVGLAATEMQIRANVSALRADPGVRARLQSDYRVRGATPLIGLSWGSRSHKKDVPGFRDWNRFIRETEGTFVSLQYGDIGAALERLRDGNKDRLIFDPGIDQLTDMDAFAAQIAALDAVVTISNTTAHLAGALGIPTLVLVDDRFHTMWPVRGESTPWYPRSSVVQRNGRRWSEVLDEARARLSTAVSG
jgi:hypothetical protein